MSQISICNNENFFWKYKNNKIKLDAINGMYLTLILPQFPYGNMVKQIFFLKTGSWWGNILYTIHEVEGSAFNIQLTIFS